MHQWNRNKWSNRTVLPESCQRINALSGLLLCWPIYSEVQWEATSTRLERNDFFILHSIKQLSQTGFLSPNFHPFLLRHYVGAICILQTLFREVSDVFNLGGVNLESQLYLIFIPTSLWPTEWDQLTKQKRIKTWEISANLMILKMLWNVWLWPLLLQEQGALHLNLSWVERIPFNPAVQAVNASSVPIFSLDCGKGKKKIPNQVLFGHRLMETGKGSMLLIFTVLAPTQTNLKCWITGFFYSRKQNLLV